MSDKNIRVLIVDDLAQVREGLGSVLALAGSATQPRIEVTGEAENGRDAIRQARSLRPDVILMDLEMPVLDGYTATRCIKRTAPSTWLIALTIHDDQETRRKAGFAGVDVFIAKGAPLEELIQAILSRPETGAHEIEFMETKK